MGVRNDGSKFVVIKTKPFHFHFNLPKDVGKHLKLEIDHIVKHNGFLSEKRIKIRD